MKKSINKTAVVEMERLTEGNEKDRQDILYNMTCDLQQKEEG